MPRRSSGLGAGVAEAAIFDVVVTCAGVPALKDPAAGTGTIGATGAVILPGVCAVAIASGLTGAVGSIAILFVLLDNYLNVCIMKYIIIIFKFMNKTMVVAGIFILALSLYAIHGICQLLLMLLS
jgi:hypothetical protein